MTIDQATPVGQLVADRPPRARVFERFGIDYCCAGKKTLADACRQRDLDPDDVLSAILEEDESAGAEDATDWTSEPLDALVEHIVDTHHVYLRRELPRIGEMVDKVNRVHGGRRPELAEVRATFRGLQIELQTHMFKEEQVLFPLIVTLVNPETAGQVQVGAIAGPISVMESEHDSAGNALVTLRRLTDDYTPPEDACNTYRAMLSGIEELERDLHQHIHKENNILFPRAAAIDRGRA